VWIGSSLDDLRTFPDEPKRQVGIALLDAQKGGKNLHAKPLHGFRGASVLEIVEDFDTDTYRAVYTVRFEDAVYVLHCFQKKSKSGIATPRQDVELIKRRYRAAEVEHMYRKIQPTTSAEAPSNEPKGKRTKRR
jgi:phage-related protein